jgi:hypothetical protein
MESVVVVVASWTSTPSQAENYCSDFMAAQQQQLQQQK